MNDRSRELTAAFVERRRDAMRTARHDKECSAVATVNRSYYAAFYAASAVFASDGKTFTKHTGVRAALHRDLVKTSRLPESIGNSYDELFEARGDGDYNVEMRLTTADAVLALERAEAVASAMLGLIGEKLD